MSSLNLQEELKEKLKGISDTPHLDVLFFLANYPNKKPTKKQIDDFILRRRLKEPVSKIIGKRGFWKLDFHVSKDVLDPRPDSETLVESVLTCYPDRDQSLSILDIGTGSGCLLVSLLGEYKKAFGVGIDVSEAALKIAQGNTFGTAAIFKKMDFTSSDFGRDLPLFDVIISNPPYIKKEEIDLLDESVKNYDPRIALDGGTDGLDAYRALAPKLKGLLKKDGKIFFEIGAGQEKEVVNLMEKEGFFFLQAQKDIGGIIRVLVFE